MSDSRFQTPDEAIAALAERISPVARESVSIAQAVGRVSAETLFVDRDSPACDVSAMDGYAVRSADVSLKRLPVSGEAAAGRPAPSPAAGSAVRIFTGAPIPEGSDAVIKREDVEERPDEIVFPAGMAAIRPGQNIRRGGENAKGGDVLLTAGTPLNPLAIGAMANCGIETVSVFRRVRAAIVTTGDEVCGISETPQPWQVRNSNQFSLRAFLERLPLVELGRVMHCPDRLEDISQALETAAGTHDLVFLTGGVSVGDRDFVPEALQSIGAETLFHKLPIRPGKPLLAAVKGASLFLGLPGNPVSVMYCARRFGLPAIRVFSGLSCREPESWRRIVNPDEKTLHLHWGRLVRQADDAVLLLPNKGSGDIIAAGRSDGFVEVPPGQSGEGPFRYFSW